MTKKNCFFSLLVAMMFFSSTFIKGNDASSRWVEASGSHLSQLQSVENRLNPPFPRIVYQTPSGSSRPGYSDGAFAEILSKYDLLAMPGGGEWNSGIADDIRAINPDAIILGTSKQGVWPGSDPAQCFVLRSGTAHLLASTSAGDAEILLDSIDAVRKVSIDQPDRYKFAVINNNDVIEYSDYEQVANGYKLTGIPVEGELAVDNHPSGQKVKSIIRFPGFGMLQDFSSYAPRISDGRECWQYFIDNRFEITDFTAYDGVAYDAYRDAFWATDFGEDIDFDRNDINDIDEHGLEWVNEKWKEGIIKTIEYEKQKFAQLNPDKPVLYMINTGHGGDSYLKEYVNGVLFEGFMRFAWNWRHMVESQQAWMDALENRGEPLLYTIEDYVKEVNVLDGKNDFSYMRYGITTTLMGDGYYGRTFGDWFYISLWYDEFETQLGYPRSTALKLETHCRQEPGQEEFCVHVRFFDEGVVISNPTTTSQMVTDEDLRAFTSFYDGPYYRFLGGQNPEFNNGQLFSSVELFGEAGSREKYNRGDGIILLKQPRTIVSDIIVGNHENNDTSPGGMAAEYYGEWERKLTKGDVNPPNPYYSQWNVNYSAYDVYEGSGYSVSGAGKGGNYAIYKPTIGVPGTYEVFEWHGWHGDTQASYQEGTNVPHEIHHAGGITTTYVNQQVNPGQWNSLGTYSFSQGTQGYVKISNDADGFVIADAIKFVLRSDSPSPTFVDVSFDHWAHDEIEVLYQEGYVAGCSTDPLMYCPEQIMTRAESAVFVERGVHGADYLPVQPADQIFADVPLGEWFAKWSTALWNDGYTDGCGTDPLIYCPLQEHTRTEGCVFFLRMMHGVDYVPPNPQGIFTDVSPDWWGAKWIEAAYTAGLIPACETVPELRFCPDDPLDRAMGAHMMVQAKGLSFP